MNRISGEVAIGLLAIAALGYYLFFSGISNTVSSFFGGSTSDSGASGSGAVSTFLDNAEGLLSANPITGNVFPQAGSW